MGIFGKKKKFDGKHYEWTANTTTKLEANNIAKRYREKGYNARISRYRSRTSSSGYRYDVWIRRR